MHHGGRFNGTIRPQHNFDAETTARALHKAMKGLGCDKQKVIHELTRINCDQRQIASAVFKRMYGKSLKHELKSELSGDLEDVILGLMQLPQVYDAVQLHKALSGIGTKEKILIEIICSRTNHELHAIKAAYREKYEKSLEDDVKGDTSGDFEKLLVSLLQAHRDEGSSVDELRANQDAHKLLDAGERKVGTDESAFITILGSQSPEQLRRVFIEYEKITGHSLKKAIKSEFSGDLQDCLLTIVRCIKNKPKFFAKRLHKAMEGIGTHDKDLIRLIISRAENDLELVKQEFLRKYEKTLADAVRSECSGAYRDSLLEIIDGN